VYALSRDEGIPFSSIWRKIHPKHKVSSNAVWLCAAICILLGLTILKVNVVSTAITSTCTIGWVGGYAVPIFARMVMAEKHFKAGPILPRQSKEVTLLHCLSVDLLYLFSFSSANLLPHFLGYIQLCAGGFGRWFDFDKALAGVGCKGIVQGTC